MLGMILVAADVGITPAGGSSDFLISGMWFVEGAWSLLS